MNKRFVFALAIAVVIASVITQAQQPQFNITQYRSAFAVEQITVTGTATIFTAATYNPTVTDGLGSNTRAEIAQFECDNVSAATIRFWTTGDAPTATVGIEIFPNQIVTIYGYHDIVNFKAIRTASTSVTCNVQYYRFATNTP